MTYHVFEDPVDSHIEGILLHRCRVPYEVSAVGSPVTVAGALGVRLSDSMLEIALLTEDCVTDEYRIETRLRLLRDMPSA